jgi:cell division protein FtsL
MMHNMMIRLSWTLVACLGLLQADYIELRDGRRIDGRILAENPDGLEIEIGANEAGTIRRVLIIHASEIATWAADERERVAGSRERTVNRLAGTDYVKRLMDDAESKIREQRFDEGILGFQEAAEIATRNLDELEGREKVAALKIRTYALRMSLAAMEGKLEMIKTRMKTSEDRLDERIDQWEDAWKELQKEIRDAERSNERPEQVELGARFSRAPNDFEEREQRLNQRKAILDQEKSLQGVQKEKFEMMSVQTKAQVELVKERIDQAEDEVKDAERALRRR